MAKFGVNVVVLVDNMPLVFFIFLQNLSKKILAHYAHTYYEKKILTKLPTKKKNSCRRNFSTPLSGYLMVHMLGQFTSSGCHTPCYSNGWNDTFTEFLNNTAQQLNDEETNYLIYDGAPFIEE